MPHLEKGARSLAESPCSTVVWSSSRKTSSEADRVGWIWSAATCDDCFLVSRFCTAVVGRRLVC